MSNSRRLAHVSGMDVWSEITLVPSSFQLLQVLLSNATSEVCHIGVPSQKLVV